LHILDRATLSASSISELALFVVAAVAFGFVLRFTSFGRRIFAIGANPVAARYSGVSVERIKFQLFCLTGLMSGVVAVLITSRLGSTRPSIAQGYELDVITMVVSGGVSIQGGGGHSRRRARGSHHGFGDLWPRSSQHTRPSHVDYRWSHADRGHRGSPCLAKAASRAVGLTG
jgi:hypothetical protein